MPNKLVIKKTKQPITLVVPTKVVEPIAKVTTQHIKPTRVPLKYPCIIYSSYEHHAPNFLKKTKVQNMFCIKSNTTTTIVPKSFKLDNVPINVIVVVTTCNQVLEQQVLRECEPMKEKNS